ncbi:hypothetical protein TELCIR_18571 [Teladorsagia circumcincta]|uniref:Piezo non-specific cation channel cap domain-containing protein n=1 Tax=Teladorsagia circumcincta TaxID=45464 RepID=A0A2G9TPM0_TELCI|nr:hypothetical protein TELCIR_18571 [Teladorsagia circumcincta]
MYISLVIVVGRLIRALFTHSPTEVMITEIPNPDFLLKICLDIYLVREAKDFFLEQRKNPTSWQPYYVLNPITVQIAQVISVDDDGEFKGRTKTIILSIGITLAAIGGLGYVFTIYEVIKRGHEKLVKGHKRKLEEQVDRKRKETAAMEARKQTIRIMDELPPVEVPKNEPRVEWM